MSLSILQAKALLQVIVGVSFKHSKLVKLLKSLLMFGICGKSQLFNFHSARALLRYFIEGQTWCKAKGRNVSSLKILIHTQYLNCKILHGGRFCSLDQTHLACESTLVTIMQFRLRN